MSAELKNELTKEELWYLDYYGKCKEPSELGLKVALILTKLYHGMHHVPTTQIEKIDWTSNTNIKFSTFTTMASYDDNLLTRLIILVHEYCIRVEIQPCNFRYFTVMFSKREGREGPTHDRHPTVEQAGLKEIADTAESGRKCYFCYKRDDLKAIYIGVDDDTQEESCCYSCYNYPDHHMEDGPVDSMEWFSTDYNWNPISSKEEMK